MKLYLTLLFIFSFALISAQSTNFNSEKGRVSDSTVNGKKSFSDKKFEDLKEKVTTDSKDKVQKSIAGQNIVQEINVILNYKVNRVWSEDLYCLVCLKNRKSRQIA